jgi:hypothetical protein
MPAEKAAVDGFSALLGFLARTVNTPAIDATTPMARRRPVTQAKSGVGVDRLKGGGPRMIDATSHS